MELNENTTRKLQPLPRAGESLAGMRTMSLSTRI
jgi:hypothetical protein